MTSASFESLQSVLDFSQTGMCVLSPVFDHAGDVCDFQFKAVNRQAAALLNQTPNELLESRVSAGFKQSRDQGDTFQFFNACYQTRSEQRFEINYNPTGFDVWLDIQGRRQDDDLLVTFTDITLLKHAQHALEWQARKNQEQADLLNSILDSSDSGIMAFEAIRDPRQDNRITDFRFLMANEACVPIVGRPVNTLIGRSLLRVFPGNVESGLFAGYARTTETGEPFRTVTYYNYDGLDFWLSISAQKMGDGFVVTFSDISVFKRLQQQLENSVADLQRSNENLQQFAYVASHDLQEPLRKIQAFGDLLRQNYAEPLGDGADMIGRMQGAANRMSNLIRDLLAYSRLSAQPASTESVSLTTILRQVLDDLELSIQESSAVIRSTELPTVSGDAFQLQQLFQNIISNAIKFRKPTEPPLIQITTECVPYDALPDDVKPLRRALAYQAISFTDNGIGFDERYRERIFQVFQRLHGKQQYVGTGIGLAIVQRVADNHGGAVAAQGLLGEGATFTVYLPG